MKGTFSKVPQNVIRVLIVERNVGNTLGIAGKESYLDSEKHTVELVTFLHCKAVSVLVVTLAVSVEVGQIVYVLNFRFGLTRS